jgi:hypothetical protein
MMLPSANVVRNMPLTTLFLVLPPVLEAVQAYWKRKEIQSQYEDDDDGETQEEQLRVIEGCLGDLRRRGREGEAGKERRWDEKKLRMLT